MFPEKLRAASRRNSSFLCIGLDPDPALMPHPHIPSFLQEIVEATVDLVCAYKPNLAFFEALGSQGMGVLLESLADVPRHIPIIADGKRNDIPSTARFYAHALFEAHGFDAATVNPYLGYDAVEPFLAYGERGVFLLCRTSNRGAADIQDLPLADGRRLYEAVAELARDWNRGGNIGLVMGATWPQEVARVRALCPEMTLLLLGVGAQGADVATTLRAGMDARGQGFIISSSRRVLYASGGKDFARAARRAAQVLREEINGQREALLAQASPGRSG